MIRQRRSSRAQEAAGTDIIELGIPFSDPVADGPVIQAASYEAILGGANLEKTFTCMKEMRTDGVQIPVVFMMYYNTVLHYGVEKFVKECNACGVDGLIIPDLPLEEQEELQTQLQKEDGTILIQLVSPVSKDRVPKSLKMHGDLSTVCLPWELPDRKQPSTVRF